ncbi:MAG: hypothetical protein QOF84_4795 [Streptomyces sp.]|nr:hypothetical protein [Streptomyces sp.]
MYAAYVAVSAVVVAYCVFSAVMDFIRYEPILVSMTKAGVPHSWLPRLGALKAAGALGVLLGLIGVPWIGAAAAVGIVLFFVGAIATHVRARDTSFGLAAAFLALALAALVLGVNGPGYAI